MNPWRFDLDNDLNDNFQETLLLVANSDDVKTVVHWALQEIGGDPHQSRAIGLDGEVFYGYRTGRHQMPGGIVQPMLLTFALDDVERIIYLISICFAHDVAGAETLFGEDWSSADVEGLRSREHADHASPEPIEAYLRRTLHQAQRKRRH